jgi:hypothetical protein
MCPLSFASDLNRQAGPASEWSSPAPFTLARQFSAASFAGMCAVYKKTQASNSITYFFSSLIEMRRSRMSPIAAV